MEKHLQTINSPLVSQEERLAAAEVLAGSYTPDLDAVCEVDLHVHSFYSDGYHSPAGRVFEAWRRRMKGVALTDHDNFDGCVEALDAGEIFGIDVIPGIEFYTDRPGIEIIAWWPDADYFREWLREDGGRDTIEPIRQGKSAQLSAMRARVSGCFSRCGLDMEITDVDIVRYVRNGISTKGDISVVLWQKYGAELAVKKVASDVKDFHNRFTVRDDELNVPLKLEMDISPKAFVRRIRKWGGLPGIPHPTELRSKEGLDNSDLARILDELGDAGLQALEVDGWRNSVCPESGLSHTDLFMKMISEYGERHPDRLPLIPTGGSDDHNQPGEGLELGCGRNRNLRAEFGSCNIIEKLRQRAQKLADSHNILDRLKKDPAK